MTQPTPVVETHGLTFSYGTEQVLNGLSFSVSEGEVFGVMGPRHRRTTARS